ncbi:unnamed protein product [Discula destructiva]
MALTGPFDPPTTAPPPAQSSGIPLWALIIIAIGGTVILVTSIVLPLIFLKRWRRRRRRAGGYRKRILMIDGREVSVYRGGGGGGGGCGGSSGSSGDTSTETLERPGKLRKKKKIRVESGGRGMMSGNGGDAGWSSSDDEGDDGGASKLGGYLGLPPVLPMIRRASSGLMSVANSSRKSLVGRASSGVGEEEAMCGAMVVAAAGGPHQRPGPGHRRRTSNAWVDEDAIHGPEMNISPRGKSKRGRGRTGSMMGKGNGSKERARRSLRRSLRESWPLSSISPTLPKLASFGPFGSPRLNGHSHHNGAAALPQRPPGLVIHDAPSTYRFQHHLTTIPRLAIPPGNSAAGAGATPQYSPPRQLPKPPCQALLAANDETAGRFRGGGVGGGASSRAPSPAGAMPGVGNYGPRDRGLSYYVYEDPSNNNNNNNNNMPAVPAPLRLSTSSRRGQPSADSTLTHILRTTEQRLAEGGGGGGSMRRSRSSLGPSTMGMGGGLGRARSCTVSTGISGESNLTLVGSGTPSPPKPSARKGTCFVQLESHHHSRGNSRDSVLSEVDSLVAPPAETTPEGGYFHALSSPSKGSPNRGSPPRKDLLRQQQELVLIDSPNSGELSDLLEVDETAVDDDHGNTAPAGIAELKDTAARRVTLQNSDDDPFMSKGQQQQQRLSDGPRVHAFKDAPRLQGGPSPIMLSVLRSESPLSNISGNSRSSPDLRGPRRSTSPQQRGVQQQPQQQQQQQGKVHQTTPRLLLQPMPGPPQYLPPRPKSSMVSPTASLVLQPHPHRRTLPTVVDMENQMAVPAISISLTSPSYQGSPAPVAKRLSELRAQASSPTLGWRHSRERTPEIVPPSMALSRASSYYDTCGEDDDARSDGVRRRISDGSSHFTEFEREKLAALSNANLHELMVRGDRDETQRFGGRRRSQTIRLVTPEPRMMATTTSPGAGVVPTIAQLRRMNSQVSGYSDGGSSSSSTTTTTTLSSGASGAGRPSSTGLLLPTLREEGTGRFVRPPRSREASLNYLAIGRLSKGSLGSRIESSGSGSGGVTVHGYDQQLHHHDKENARCEGGAMELKMLRIDSGDGEKAGRRTPESPSKRSSRAVEASPDRKSEGSESPYDADGFWIPSPERRAARRA